MTETILQDCADYHRERARLHDGLASVSTGTSHTHHLRRAESHASWRAEIETAIAELRKDKP